MKLQTLWAQHGDKIFQWSLLTSLAVHVSVIGFLSTSQKKVLPKPTKQIEVVYQKIEPKKIEIKKEKKRENVKALAPKKQKIRDLDVEPLRERMRYKGTKGFQETAKLSAPVPLEKKMTMKVSPFDSARKITVPLLKSEKMDNPQYLSYNEFIRAKIRQRAYDLADDPSFEAGEVYLTFVVANNGKLKQLQVIEDRTQANHFLRKVGERSVRESHPFPPFPKELSFPELTFNVVISFEVEEE